MKSKIKNFLLCCLGLFMVASLKAQNNGDSTYYYQERYEEPKNDGYVNFLTIGLGAIAPKNAFSQRLDKNLFMVNFSYFRQLFKYKPFFAGFEFAYASIDDYNSNILYEYSDGTKETLENCVISNLKQFNFIGRYYLPVRVWRFDPFAEFAYNLQWYSTNSTIYFSDNEDDNESDYIKNDLVGQYGFAAGINAIVKDDWYATFRIGYYSGLSAYYFTLKENTNFTAERTIEFFDQQKSATDMIKWDVGVTFAF